jgi:argininosuccinate synthase
MNKEIKKLILAYSGGLDTSIMIHWLQQNYPHAKIICATVDLGQPEDLESIKNKALQHKADEAYIIDAKDEFIKDYLFKLLKSGALYENQYILGTISRPLIAKKLVDLAKKINADAIVHGATGKGNDQVRFEYSITALAPEIKVIAPWRSWKITSRQDAIDYAKKHNIQVPTTQKSPYSRDHNAWYISHEGGEIENPANPQPGNVLLITKKLDDTPNTPEIISIDFEKGEPIKLNGNALSGVNLLKELNKIAGNHGIGVSDLIESRLIGMKIRGIYESPAAKVLYYAHHTLETMCLDFNMLKLKQANQQEYANIVYQGRWFSQSRKSLDALFNISQEYLTGSISLQLFKGNIIFNGASSPYSLHNQDFATFEKENVYNQADATGFIKLFSLSAKIFSLVHPKETYELGNTYENK